MNLKNGRMICRVQSRRREREREREGGGGGERRQVREKMKDRSMNTFIMFFFKR